MTKDSGCGVELSRNRSANLEAFVSHANAALTPRARLRLARLIVDQGWPVARAAERYDVSWPTAKRWAVRYAELGADGMVDRSSRPHHSPTRTPQPVVRKVVHLRWKHRLGPVQIAGRLGMPASTLHAVLTRCRRIGRGSRTRTWGRRTHWPRSPQTVDARSDRGLVVSRRHCQPRRHAGSRVDRCTRWLHVMRDTEVMEFFCYHRDRPGSIALRKDLLETHWSYMDRYTSQMIARGPTLASDGGTPTGSLHIVDLPDPAAVRALLRFTGSVPREPVEARTE